MHVTALVAGIAVVLLVLWEAFETLVLPRRVSRRLRFTRGFYRVLWGTWTRIGPHRRGLAARCTSASSRRFRC